MSASISKRRTGKAIRPEWESSCSASPSVVAYSSYRLRCFEVVVERNDHFFCIVGLLGEGVLESASFFVFLLVAALFGLAWRVVVLVEAGLVSQIISFWITGSWRSYAVLDEEARCKDWRELARWGDTCKALVEDGLLGPKTLLALVRSLLPMFMMAEVLNYQAAITNTHCRVCDSCGI